jgi:hypothetical protein
MIKVGDKIVRGTLVWMPQLEKLIQNQLLTITGDMPNAQTKALLPCKHTWILSKMWTSRSYTRNILENCRIKTTKVLNEYQKGGTMNISTETDKPEFLLCYYFCNILKFSWKIDGEMSIELIKSRNSRELRRTFVQQTCENCEIHIVLEFLFKSKT